MTAKTVTEILMIVTCAGLIAWDIYVAAAPPVGDTISEIIRTVATKHPIIPFAIGVLCGHWFWTK